MKTFRNKWAHAPEKGYPAESVYRDLDTLRLFAEMIRCDATVIGQIRRRQQTIAEKIARRGSGRPRRKHTSQGAPDASSPLESAAELLAEAQRLSQLRAWEAVIAYCEKVLRAVPQDDDLVRLAEQLIVSAQDEQSEMKIRHSVRSFRESAKQKL